jgi:hypothetical protein
MNADQLTHTFIARGDFEQLRAHHEKLHRMASYLEGDYDVFRWLLKYANHFSRYPSFAELEEWVTGSPTLIKGLHIWEPAHVGLRIKEIAAMTVWPVHQGSWAQILEDTTFAARQKYTIDHLKTAALIIASGMDMDKRTTLKGVDDAWKFLDEARNNDLFAPSQPVTKRTETKSPPSIDELCEQITKQVAPRPTLEELAAAIGATI